MRALLQFIKTTVIGGVIVLVPVAICAYLIGIGIELVYKVTTPTLKWFGIDSAWGIAVAPLAAGLAIVVLCFVLGLAVQTAIGRYLGGWIEHLMLRHLPGYQFLKQISRQFVGIEGAELGAPVLIRLGETRQIGILVEEHANGFRTVFVPLAPAMTLGSVVIVNSDQVELLAAPLSEVLNAVGLLGYGTAKLLSPHSSNKPS